MSKLRRHDHTLDGSDWDLSLLGLKEAPVDDLQKNPKARRIDLSNNSLTKLPPTFTSLTHLIELDLSKNRLQELPQSFGQLSKLVRLDLYANQLKTLPISFGQLSKLKWLDLKDNPLDPLLAKYAGDCANERQCQICAINCLKFMKSEKIRIESEMRVKEEKLKQRQEFEKRMDDKNKKEKERQKAKTARRSARKTQPVVETTDNGDIKDEDSDSNVRTNRNKSRNKSSGSSVFSVLLFVIRFLLSISLVLFLLFIGLSIGLYLQNGHKLETLDDIKTALINGFQSIQNPNQLTKETTILIQNIVKALRNWRKTFNVFDNKQNSTKN